MINAILFSYISQKEKKLSVCEIHACDVSDSLKHKCIVARWNSSRLQRFVFKRKTILQEGWPHKERELGWYTYHHIRANLQTVCSANPDIDTADRLVS